MNCTMRGSWLASSANKNIRLMCPARKNTCKAFDYDSESKAREAEDDAVDRHDIAQIDEHQKAADHDIPQNITRGQKSRLLAADGPGKDRGDRIPLPKVVGKGEDSACQDPGSRSQREKNGSRDRSDGDDHRHFIQK